MRQCGVRGDEHVAVDERRRISAAIRSVEELHTKAVWCDVMADLVAPHTHLEREERIRREMERTRAERLGKPVSRHRIFFSCSQIASLKVSFSFRGYYYQTEKEKTTRSSVKKVYLSLLPWKQDKQRACIASGRLGSGEDRESIGAALPDLVSAAREASPRLD